MRIVLGIGGGIAAYKAAMLLRLFSEAGHHVVPIPTRSALEFVGAATWEALSGEVVTTDVFDRVSTVNHVSQGQAADLVVVAPATADLLARAAHGHADDLLTTTLLATQASVLFAPAMHTEMWDHPAVQANVATLRSHGHTVLEPDVGRLTGKDSGAGRLPSPEAIRDAALALVQEDSADTPLRGVSAVVSTGGTREPLDPVRYLGNRSSGKQGIAIAEALAAAGAAVELVAAHVDVPLPDEHTARPGSVRVTRVSSADELQRVMENFARSAQVVVMAAAVADFRPVRVERTKIKKTEDAAEAPTIHLVRNPDILQGLVEQRRAHQREQIVVGFAAETGDDQYDPLTLGKAKMRRKGCDLLCVNQVGTDLVFGQDATTVTILSSHGAPPVTVQGSKHDVAVELTRHIVTLRDRRHDGPDGAHRAR